VTPDISVLLLTRNGSSTLPAVLEAVAGQVTDARFEIVAVDSGSTDGTPDLLRKFDARCLTIAPEQFNHGLTRNFGIEQCRGQFIVLLVQDAVPATSRWLAELVAPLLIDAQLAGSYARQVPRPDASALTRFYHRRWVAASEISRTTRIPDADAFRKMAPADQFLTCVFDDVCSCVRRAVWERFPFRATPIGEDFEWGREVLLAGYGLAYVAEAVVIHSHDRSPRYELMRTYLVHQRLRAVFGLSTIPDLWSLMRAIAWAVPVHLKHSTNGSLLRTSPRELMRVLVLALVFPLGQYLGARSTDRGREILRAAGV
jgi:rhamnosyltransferase